MKLLAWVGVVLAVAACGGGGETGPDATTLDAAVGDTAVRYRVLEIPFAHPSGGYANPDKDYEGATRSVGRDPFITAADKMSVFTGRKQILERGQTTERGAAVDAREVAALCLHSIGAAALDGRGVDSST